MPSPAGGQAARCNAVCVRSHAWPKSCVLHCRRAALRRAALLCAVLQGDRVKIVMKFEGRELQFKETGKEVLLVRASSRGGV